MNYKVVKSPLDSAIIRDKPIWICTQCNEKIFAQDIALAIVLRSDKAASIPCPACRHIDEPLKRRTYKGNLV